MIGKDYRNRKFILFEEYMEGFYCVTTVNLQEEDSEENSTSYSGSENLFSILSKIHTIKTESMLINANLNP
jgi:hypothetical protein